MLSKKTHLFICVLFLGLSACSDQPKKAESSLDFDGSDGDQTDVGEAKPGTPSTRNNLMTMSFTKWGDVIAVDAGIVQLDAKDGKCKFSKPVKSDQSTKWNPFQIYWVIFDRQDDVRNGTELNGVFAENESFKSDSLVRADGARPRGFSYLTDQAAGYVNMTPVTMHDEDSRLHTVLNVAGHKAAIRAFVELAKDGCVTRTEACRGGEECYENGTFAPLGNIHVVQNIIGLPKEVRQEPANRVTQTN